MNLYLMRHGDAQPSALTDAQRELTSRGQHQVAQVAAGLRSAGIEPDLIISSPFVRAIQTADRLVECQAPCGERRTADCLLPDGDPRAVLTWLGQLDGHHVMLVSHMPLLGNLAGLLLHGNLADAFGFDKAAMLALQVDEISPGMARQCWYRSSDEWEIGK